MSSFFLQKFIGKFFKKFLFQKPKRIFPSFAPWIIPDVLPEELLEVPLRVLRLPKAPWLGFSRGGSDKPSSNFSSNFSDLSSDSSYSNCFTTSFRSSPRKCFHVFLQKKNSSNFFSRFSYINSHNNTICRSSRTSSGLLLGVYAEIFLGVHKNSSCIITWTLC